MEALQVFPPDALYYGRDPLSSYDLYRMEGREWRGAIHIPPLSTKMERGRALR